jgi:hypothetical protein
VDRLLSRAYYFIIMFAEIRTELIRIGATDVRFKDENSVHLRIWIGPKSCTVIAAGFLTMLRGLPSAAGTAAVQQALQAAAQHADSWAIG